MTDDDDPYKKYALPEDDPSNEPVKEISLMEIVFMFAKLLMVIGVVGKIVLWVVGE